MEIIIVGGYKKNRHTGVGKYVHDLADMLIASKQPTKVIYESFHSNYILRLLERFIFLPFRIRRSTRNTLITILPDESYSFLLPSISSQKKSIIIHDIRPLSLAGGGYYLLREYFLRIQNLFFLRLANIIITPSEFTRKCVGSGIVIPNVFDISSERHEDQLPKELIGKKYILYVGTNQFRKNFITADKVGQQAKEKYNLEFVCIGNVEPSAGKKIKGISNKQLNSIYQNAFALINPSLFEGFGRVVIEAQIQGCPVISTNNSALGEVLEDSALFVTDAEDPLQYLEHIEFLLHQHNREMIVQKGFINSKRYKKEKNILNSFLTSLEVYIDTGNQKSQLQ